MPLDTSALLRSYKMQIQIITDDFGQEHAIIDRGNGEYTSMLKSTYDEMIAQQEQSTENPTEDVE